MIASLAAAFAVVIGAVQWWKYVHFGYNGLDLGIYSQTIWSLAHGHGFASSIHDPSYLGDHLELWLVPISWLYRLWSSPVVLLWLQTIIIASTAVPLAKLAGRVITPRAAVVVTALFFLNPLVYNIALYEFHGLVVALPLLAWSIWWYSQRRYWPWVVSLFAILLVREDMPLVVAGWGILAAIDRRSWRWWLAPLVLAGTWYPLAQTVIRAAGHDGVYKYLAFYRWLGDTPGAMLTYPFHHPVLFLQHTLTLNNLGTATGLLVCVGFLPLLRPRRLWPMVFLLAQFVLSNAQPSTFLRIHYPIPYLPFLIWASVSAWRDVARGRLFPRFDHHTVKLAVTLLAIVAPLYSSFILGPAEWPWHSGNSGQPTLPSTLRQALHDVQPNDRVLTTFAYLPYLANRPSLYSLNYLYLGRRQYSEIPYAVPTGIDVAVIDWQQLYDYQFLYHTTVFLGRSGLQRITDLFATQGLGLVQQYGTVAVYRRGGGQDTSAVESPDLAVSSSTTYGPVAVIGAPKVSVGPKTATAGTSLLVQTAWRAVATKLDEPVSVRYTLRQGRQLVWQESRLVGQGPHPASEWAVNTTWVTHDVLDLSSQLSGQLELSMTLFRPQGRYRLNRLRTFRPIIDSQRTFGTVALGVITP